ncbi:hypothetical protein [Kineosporia mesophila]|uniref:hypothetical protein n=1 Tax=Kineosporia mesophila TaxID=566012 RepID=UPI001E4A8820|nr:hypothetical protein [Kineosporia mesophila]MCD5354787.1 hypothetical protein [Kineosporia mesophila]
MDPGGDLVDVDVSGSDVRVGPQQQRGPAVMLVDPFLVGVGEFVVGEFVVEPGAGLAGCSLDDRAGLPVQPAVPVGG